jgi:hypothetical protein
MTILNEIKDRIARGYKGELLFNLRTGNYEITTWLDGAENIDQKLHKIPHDLYDSNTLKRAVYGKISEEL